jgi:maltose alpha-D-glucosyltransferase/alpha-amylase
LTGPQGERFESEILPRFLPQQRWFGGKSRRIQSASVIDWTEFADPNAALVLLQVEYGGGEPDRYFVPLAMTIDRIADVPSASVLCRVSTRGGVGVLHDAAGHEPTRDAFLGMIEQNRTLSMRRGQVSGLTTAAFKAARGPVETALHAVRRGAEQSNTSIVYGDRLILKLFRRLHPGPNPELEIGRYLIEERQFPHIPTIAGTIEHTPAEGDQETLAVLQTLLPNQGDGWSWTLEELERYYSQCSSLGLPAETDHARHVDVVTLAEQPVPQLARENMGLYLDAAAALGRRSAELHLALASPTTNPAFAPERLSTDDLIALGERIRDTAGRVFEGIRDGLPALSDSVVELAGTLLSRRRFLLDGIRDLGTHDVGGLRTRVHGDYHLGQVIRVKNDYAILDFEGEPTRSLAERRLKQSPLKDVAGMLRSFSYAAWASLLQFTTRGPDQFERLEPWARLWENAASAAFLRAYLDTAREGSFLPDHDNGLRSVLGAYILEKTLYEALYELNNRPAWIWIPLRSLLREQT